MSKVSEADALLNAFAVKYREEGRREAMSFYQSALLAKDRELVAKELELERLKQQLVKLQNNTQLKDTNNSRTYNYDASTFSKPNGDIIIEALIELTTCKREGGRYIINSKTDWYLVWKVVHYFKIYVGSEYNFICLVNECVLPYIDDEERKSALELNDSNFKSIKQDSPMKKHAVMNWRRELENEREACSTSQHGTLVLDRGVNIMVKLQQLLKAKEVESYNYEK